METEVDCRGYTPKTKCNEHRNLYFETLLFLAFLFNYAHNNNGCSKFGRKKVTYRNPHTFLLQRAYLTVF